MKAKQHAQFKRGDAVTWKSQANGSKTKKAGVIIEVVQAGASPSMKSWMLLDIRNIRHSAGRTEKSYVVRVGKKLYWPRVKNLMLTSTDKLKGK